MMTDDFNLKVELNVKTGVSKDQLGKVFYEQSITLNHNQHCESF